MTIRYVYDSSAQDDSDSTWNSSTISYLTLQAALTAWASGDVVYVAHDHAESQAASLTLTCAAASNTDRVPIYRVNRSTGSYAGNPGGAGTPQIDVTGAGNNFNCEFEATMFGLHIRAVNRINFTSADVVTFAYDCYFEAGGFISTGAPSAANSLNGRNNTYEFTAGGAYQYVGAGKAAYEGYDFVGDFHSTGSFRPISSYDAFAIDFIACDFTGMTNPASEPIVDMTRANTASADINLVACLVDTSRPAVDVTAIGNPDTVVNVHNTTDDGDTFISQRYMATGTVDTDTSVYFTGTDAAVDADGDTPVSREMVPTSLCAVHEPLQSIDMIARVDSTGSKTFTVEIVENFTSALTKQECWLEVFSLNGASSTLWSLDYGDREFIEGSYTNLAAGAGLASWTGEPASSRSEKVTVTATVNQAGMFLVRLHLGKYESGKEFFYNPVVTVT